MRRVLLALWALRRWRVRLTVAAKARSKRARVALTIDPTSQVSTAARFVVLHGSVSTVEIGPGCTIDDGVLVQLRGGTLRLGPGCSIRRGSVLDVVGDLTLEGRNIISYGNVLHCAEQIRFGELAATAEYVSVVDSVHRHGDDGQSFRARTDSSPIEIGRNVWLANKSTVLLGVTIGDEAVVAAHSLVNKDVPARSTVAGTPARVIAQR
ncbi:MAG TPA: hypothetical protein VNB24_06065 [Acidimicrobiales bacterium]|nr:hypothetical protein [Acidimicrobiales bacterium]